MLFRSGLTIASTLPSCYHVPTNLETSRGDIDADALLYLQLQAISGRATITTERPDYSTERLTVIEVEAQ